ncbi:nucleotide sugar dehydrogenase [Priestia abyssalis]|uniref:nucleotide sugar dehydrogenase n=1 Tax=Priestia abyssalis TaxID=1221450 RepID=UPI000995A418|nr:nucleotide sugar dehydrogenase [Priestia abyssalis]
MSKTITNVTVENLFTRIKNKTAKIGIIGLGYVGLPLAVEIAKSEYNVVGFDVNQQKVDSLNNGHNYINDVNDEDLVKIVENNKFISTTDFSQIQQIDVVLVCVPTPIDAHQHPDISYIQSATKNIANYIHDEMLIVLESTTYPNTTKEVMLPILMEKGHKVGEDFFLAYSPERVDPGNENFKTKNIPKIVGGITEDCTMLTSMFYKSVLNSNIHEVSSPAVAEMAKILENTFRNINIGLANEMAIICNKMGIDVWEVINAAATKPFGFMPFYPGPGLGGHCIPIDPFYLSWKVKEYKYHVRLIETSSEINNYMPEFVVERSMKILNEVKKPLNGSNVLLVGAAYKKDIDDIRESPIFEIIKYFEGHGANVFFNDPYISEFNFNGKKYVSFPLNKENLSKMDLSIIVTNHTSLDYKLIAEHSKIIFDTRNAMGNYSGIKGQYYKL